MLKYDLMYHKFSAIAFRVLHSKLLLANFVFFCSLLFLKLSFEAFLPLSHLSLVSRNVGSTIVKGTQLEFSSFCAFFKADCSLLLGKLQLRLFVKIYAHVGFKHGFVSVLFFVF